VRLRRFEQEAYAASSLNHPNILTIYEIGVEDGHHFIATEFIDGESLRQHLSGGTVELRDAMEIGVQVASALAGAHTAGIVHRDIKPENIMVRRDGFVKVLDFGLAKLMEKQVPADPEAATMQIVKTDPGVVMGTAAYMSPEQARGSHVDARTDIWSFGCVVYEMVTGRRPFEGKTTSDVIGLILHKEPPPLARFAPDVPAELERIVTKTLRKDREERYQVMKDLALDLKSLKQRMEFEAELERTTPPEERSAATRGVATGSGAAARAETVTHDAAGQTGGARERHTTSSAEHIVGEITRHKKGVGLIVTWCWR